MITCLTIPLVSTNKTTENITFEIYHRVEFWRKVSRKIIVVLQETWWIGKWSQIALQSFANMRFLNMEWSKLSKHLWRNYLFIKLPLITFLCIVSLFFKVTYHPCQIALPPHGCSQRTWKIIVPTLHILLI